MLMQADPTTTHYQNIVTWTYYCLRNYFFYPDFEKKIFLAIGIVIYIKKLAADLN